MIRINLLKPLEPQAPLIILAEPPDKRKKLALIGGGLALVVLIAVALLQYPSLLGGMMSGSKRAAAAPVVSPEPKPKAVDLDSVRPKRVTANAVEETVKDVGDQSERQAASRTYGDLVPSEKIEYQYFASARVLKDIKAVTPPDVGFANFIFTPPGDFYVHGLAGDDESYRHFKTGLSGMANATVRAGMEAPAGVHGTGKEFSFYGTINYPLNAVRVPVNHVIPKAKIQEELQRLKTVAAGLGIRIKPPKLTGTAAVGDGKRLIYATSADCSFQQMQDLIGELSRSKSNLGILRFNLRARGDEKVVADLDILLYVD